MVASLLLAFLSLRSGLALRRTRRGLARRHPAQRPRHLRLAKTAVAMILAGFVAGPASMAWLRGESPFGTVHALLGGLAAALFGGAALLGRRLERGRSRAFDPHAVMGVLAVLAGAVAAVAGFVLLP